MSSLSLLPTDTHYMSLCDFLRCTSSFLVWTDFYYFALLDIMKACKNVLGYIQKMPSFLMMKLINQKPYTNLLGSNRSGRLLLRQHISLIFFPSSLFRMKTLCLARFEVLFTPFLVLVFHCYAENSYPLSFKMIYILLTSEWLLYIFL